MSNEFDHEETFSKSFEVGDNIEKARRKYSVLESKTQIKEAEVLFKKTQIQEILTAISTALQLIGHVNQKNIEENVSFDRRLKSVR